MLLGAAVFAYGITTMCAVIANLDLRGVAFRAHMDQLDAYMVYRDIPKPLKIRVRKYVAYMKSSATGCFFDEAQLMADLSPNLQKQVMMHGFADKFTGVLTKVSLFMDTDPAYPGSSEWGQSLLNRCIFFIKSGVYAPDDMVVCKGIVTPAIYILKEGECFDRFLGKQLYTHEEASWFGMESCIRKVPARCDVIAKTLCDIFILPAKNMHELFEEDDFAGLSMKLRGDGRSSVMKINSVYLNLTFAFCHWRAILGVEISGGHAKRELFTGPVEKEWPAPTAEEVDLIKHDISTLKDVLADHTTHMDDMLEQMTSFADAMARGSPNGLD
jgi:hyperpolarization activated cyclic nucleotide-gated potassium channel 2